MKRTTQTFAQTSNQVGQQPLNEDECSMCRNEAYLNPYMKLMISSCGHKFCESCVSRTFQNETEFSCTVCKMTLRKNNLISQNREDQALEKEARLRQRILEQSFLLPPYSHFNQIAV